MTDKGSTNIITFIAPLLMSLAVVGMTFFVVNKDFSPGSDDVSHLATETFINPPDSLEARKSIVSGDKYFSVKDYLNAKAAYQHALELDPENKAAKEKLTKTMELLRSQKAQNILFDVAIASADKLFQAGEYEKARAEYENASKILPGDPYPKNKINEIIKIEIDKKVKDDEYAKAIVAADKSYNTKNYQVALLDYRKANGIKPEEKYPQTRIREITDLLAAQKALDDAYNKAIAIADQNFKDTRYPESLTSYKKASEIKPDQSYPKSRIKEIEALMARIAKAKEDYDKYITIADSLYIEKQYMRARENYLSASSVKPGESYPKEMIAKADKMLTGQEAAMARALEEQYSKTIAAADKLMADKSYEPARAEYVKASNLKPGEAYPKDKILEIDGIAEAALKDKEEQYRQAVANGDKALAIKSYELAKSEFQSASVIKPNEAYPKTKMAEIDKQLVLEAQRKAEDAKYTHAIATGDSLFFANSLQPARAQFVAALKMKPTEAYPKNRIAEIDKAITELEKKKAADAQYEALIVKADKGFTAKTYEAARADYAKASSMKPDESYPKQRMGEIDRILGDIASLKQLDERYKASVVKADQLFVNKSYIESKAEYENALTIKQGEPYPTNRIAEITKILADLEAQKTVEENYKSTIASADKLLAEKSYDPAKAEYSKALSLKPSEQYPKTKISEIDAIFAEQSRLKSLDENYGIAISAADKLLGEKEYTGAKTKYQEALKYKPSEAYPKEKIAEADKALAEIARLKGISDQYQAAIQKADGMFAQKNYQNALVEYNKASTLKPDESYPGEKVREINRILEDLAAARALEEQYKTTVASADRLFTAKSYPEARVEYENALKLKPGEQYPVTKIAEIGKILDGIAAQKTLDENYQAAVSQADQLLASKNYEQAKTEYGKAIALKPNESYPKTKVKEIDGILAELARLKALDEEYNKTLAEADQLMTSKSYTLAKTSYQQALKLKPSEKYPQERIEEADKALAEIARLKGIDDQFTAAVGKADQLFTAKKYPEARVEYSNALKIKPDESYPSGKITEIDKILADLAAARELDEKYKIAVADADKLMAAKSYPEAKTGYQAALRLKDSESYPQEKIAEIDKILAEIEAKRVLDQNYQTTVAAADKLFAQKSYEPARAEYQKAADLKTSEAYPKTKIAEIDALLAEVARKKALDDEYASTIAKGDQLLANKDYTQAKTTYQKAKELKPSETYPTTKIDEIDKALAEIARLKGIDDQYNAEIAKADQLLLSKTYTEAKDAYNRAARIKPAEQLPKDKIAEIDGILDEIARQKDIDTRYKATVARADQFLSSKNYEQAKTEYGAALTIKSAEAYPQEKIKEIDNILAGIRATEEAYKSRVDAADKMLAEKKYEEARIEYQNASSIKPQATYPKEKISEINRTLEELMGKQKFYEKLISDADQSYTDKDLTKARDGYQRALGLFPDQPYPKERIALITARIDSLYKANKAGYDKAVADGDRFFGNFEFDKAVDAFTEAANLLPMENYPREMIAKIRRTIAENAIVDILSSAVTVTSNDEKQFTFTPVNLASRKNNFVYIKIRNLSGKPFNVLLRYGKDKTPNGGVVMRNISSDGKVNERLVSVRDQDLWSRIDNNWISISPQGGDVEVSFIQVSRAKLD